jgi:hypothetical protein
METLTTLSARSLQYYIVTRRWSTELEFSRVEKAFLEALINELLPEPGNSPNDLGLNLSISKLQALEADLVKAEISVSEQLEKLELIAENKFPELKETLAAEQACLEYKMLDLVHEFRNVKTELFAKIRLKLKSHHQRIPL